MELTQERVRELFEYIDGQLIAKARVKGRKFGRPVGCKSKTKDGKIYLIAMIDGKFYKVHRLIFLWHHGHMPEYIDHRDGDSLNNDISNLREADAYGNARNKSIGKNNTSGFKGVSWDGRRGKWAASIMVDRKRVFLGYHMTPESAHEAYKEAATRYFGEFARAA